MEIKFTIPGPPKGKQRPRICRVNGRSMAYTPKGTIEYERLVRARCVAALAKSHLEFDACLGNSDMRNYSGRKYARVASSPAVSKIFFDKDTPLEISIIALFSSPKSIDKKLKNSMLTGDILPTKKPDSDNIIKIILDALNCVAYRDDSQICKVYFDSQCRAASGKRSGADE